VVREGLAMPLWLLSGVEVVGAAADGEQALALATSLRPDVVPMDPRMPRCDGIEATRRLRRDRPGPRSARDRAQAVSCAYRHGLAR
jgi:DNA-binding NarL/FixJ family response regulator